MATVRRANSAATEPAQDIREKSQDIQEESQDIREEAAFVDYAVTAKGGLRLRAEPSLDARIITELPCGVGVLGNDRPAENGWRQVFTGRLFGWVMDKFLEPLGPGHGDG